jgi:transposase
VRTPENLEVVRAVIEPELVQAEPEQWKRIGQEVSRQLDYQPGKFFWQETVRPKYVRRTERALPPVVAPAPERVADHCLAAPGLLAQLLVGKYCDHLPFYRQEQMFWQRHGVFIARQQMVQWTAQSVRLLSGITDCLKHELRQSGYVQVDETPVRYQDPLLVGRCGQGYLWTGLVPGQCVVYEWNGTSAGLPAAWSRWWVKTLPGSSSVTATAPIRHLRKPRRPWISLGAGPTRGAVSLKPWNKPRTWRAGF